MLGDMKSYASIKRTVACDQRQIHRLNICPINKFGGRLLAFGTYLMPVNENRWSQSRSQS